MSPGERVQSLTERYSIAVITLDDAIFREMRRLPSRSFRAMLASTESQIKTLIDDSDVHAIILDLECIREGPVDALEVLQEMRRLREDLIVVAITGSPNSELPLLASRSGADHFFLKPVNCDELHTVLLQTWEKRALQSEGQWLLDQVENKGAFCSLIGGSDAMRRLYQGIKAVAESNANVVIRGESGVGKELVARAIVETGSRRDKPYVCLNCAALPEALMESELFGYERGAFTGADSAKPGMIEMADGGTLFLDEITTLHHGLQSKLLRVLPERSISASSRLPMMTWKTWFEKASFARISITASTLFRSRSRLCASAKVTSRCWRSTFFACIAPPIKNHSSNSSQKS